MLIGYVVESDRGFGRAIGGREESNNPGRGASSYACARLSGSSINTETHDAYLLFNGDVDGGAGLWGRNGGLKRSDGQRFSTRAQIENPRSQKKSIGVARRTFGSTSRMPGLGCLTLMPGGHKDRD